MPASHLLEEIWYGRHPAGLVLAPLAWLFRGVIAVRRSAYANGLLRTYRAPVPVIVVGNLSVGGTGKTPLVIYLVELLRELGRRPGVIARGYRGRASSWPQQVRPDSDPNVVGDEALLLARRAGCPVAVGPSRRDCIEALLEHADCDVIVSDDGLQHYAMARDIEIAIVDGVRRLGNGRCLPAGPLREPPARLGQVDLVVSNGLAGRGEFSMRYVFGPLYELGRPQHFVDIESFRPREVHAVAGIGFPERFFTMLRNRGLRVEPHPFTDHHRFCREDLQFGDERPLVMTEKDAVKCETIGARHCWVAPVSADLPDVFRRRFATLLGSLRDG